MLGCLPSTPEECSKTCPVPVSPRPRGLFLLTFPFSPLGQGPPNLPFPLGLAAQRIIPFSELALNAKLAFSILHKVHGTMVTCLGEEP